MNTPLLLAALSLLLAGAAVLPGCLGVLKFLNKAKARPTNAFLVFFASGPVYLVSIGLLLVSLYLTYQQGASWTMASIAAVGFVSISTFGFLLHTRFMFKPVKNPQYIFIDEAIQRFGENEMIVGVLDRLGHPFAYIVRLARRPHIVYQTEGDAPFIMTHCILSNSSMSYEIDSQFRPDNVCVAAAIANNLVFYDRNSHCSIQQIYNGSLDKLRRLNCLPTVTTSLASWKSLYPESKVWNRPKEWRDTFYLNLLSRASAVDPNSPDLVYPLERAPDPRLPLKACVMGIQIGRDTKAYPLESFRYNPLIEDTVGDEPVVFFAFRNSDFIQLFSRKVGQSQVLKFRCVHEVGFQDVETSSSWSCTGFCTAGKLKGTQLTPIPHYNRIFWCVWADFFPSTVVFEEVKGNKSLSSEKKVN